MRGLAAPPLLALRLSRRRARAPDARARARGAHAMRAPVISEAEWRESKRRTDEWVANLTAHAWTEHAIPTSRFPELEGQRAFEHRDGRRVIVSVGPHDGGWWLHVS